MTANEEVELAQRIECGRMARKELARATSMITGAALLRQQGRIRLGSPGPSYQSKLKPGNQRCQEIYDQVYLSSRPYSEGNISFIRATQRNLNTAEGISSAPTPHGGSGKLSVGLSQIRPNHPGAGAHGRIN